MWRLHLSHVQGQDAHCHGIARFSLGDIDWVTDWGLGHEQDWWRQESSGHDSGHLEQAHQRHDWRWSRWHPMGLRDLPHREGDSTPAPRARRQLQILAFHHRRERASPHCQGRVQRRQWQHLGQQHTQHEQLLHSVEDPELEHCVRSSDQSHGHASHCTERQSREWLVDEVVRQLRLNGVGYRRSALEMQQIGAGCVLGEHPGQSSTLIICDTGLSRRDRSRIAHALAASSHPPTWGCNFISSIDVLNSHSWSLAYHTSSFTFVQSKLTPSLVAAQPLAHRLPLHAHDS